jgi:hypothetical protein
MTYLTGRGVWKRSRTVHVAVGFEMDSEKADVAKKGDEVLVLEEKVNDAGVTRVRFAKGWLSVTAGDGSSILELVE